MTFYLRKTPNPSGAYPPPQDFPGENTIPITAAQRDVVIENGGFVTVAVNVQTDGSNGYTITPGPEEDAQAPGRDAAIQFQLLPNQEGQPFFPAFTGWEELRKLCGPKNQQVLLLSFSDYAGMILRDNRAAGFVVDPFGCCLSFDHSMVGHLAQRKVQQASCGQDA